jgi:osmotically-inducible protein OsmY
MNVSRLIRAAAAAAILLLLAACSSDPASVTERKLRHAFGDDAKGIVVRVDGSTATLTGTAAERSTRELAEEVARSVPGIASVQNRISGPGSSGLGKLREEALDAALEISVKEALVRVAGTAVAEAIEIEACDGMVSLRGTVGDRAAAGRAIDAARSVSGVKKVIDLVGFSG